LQIAAVVCWPALLNLFINLIFKWS
jgi:hypothetical protein